MGNRKAKLIKSLFGLSLSLSPSYLQPGAAGLELNSRPVADSLSDENIEKLHLNRVQHKFELLGKPKKLNSRYQQTLNQRVNEEMLLPWIQNALPKQFKYQYKEVTRRILASSLELELDPLFVMSVILTESTFNPLARGTSGEIGLMQLLPETAKWIAQKNGRKFRGPESLKDPVTNIDLGTLYLSYLRDKFSSHARLYISAYNMGPTNVKRALRKSVWPKDYALKIMNHYKNLYSEWSLITKPHLGLEIGDRQPASTR